MSDEIGTEMGDVFAPSRRCRTRATAAAARRATTIPSPSGWLTATTTRRAAGGRHDGAEQVPDQERMRDRDHARQSQPVRPVPGLHDWLPGHLVQIFGRPHPWSPAPDALGLLQPVRSPPAARSSSRSATATDEADPLRRRQPRTRCGDGVGPIVNVDIPPNICAGELAATLLRKFAGPAAARIVAAAAIRPLTSTRTRARKRQARTARTRELPAGRRFTHHTGAGKRTTAIGKRALVADLPGRAVRVRLTAGALSAGTAVSGRARAPPVARDATRARDAGRARYPARSSLATRAAVICASRAALALLCSATAATPRARREKNAGNDHREDVTQILRSTSS